MKKLLILLASLLAFTLLTGCQQANEVLEKMEENMDQEPTPEEVLMMYEGFIQGNPIPLSTYLGVLPESLSNIKNKKNYQQVIAESTRLFSITPEQTAVLKNLIDGSYKGALFSNRILEENDTSAFFEVTVLGRDYSPALVELYTYINTQKLLGSSPTKEESQKVLLENMKTMYIPSNPQVVKVHMAYNENNKWELDEKGIEDLQDACVLMDEETALKIVEGI